jgi:hypothetical protein
MRSRSLAVTALAVATACLDSPRYMRAPADAWFKSDAPGAFPSAHVCFGGAF